MSNYLKTITREVTCMPNYYWTMKKKIFITTRPNNKNYANMINVVMKLICTKTFINYKVYHLKPVGIIWPHKWNSTLI